jgi:hypothetical protein
LHPELRPKRPRMNDCQKVTESSSENKQKEDLPAVNPATTEGS